MKNDLGDTPLHFAALATERSDDSAEVIGLLLDAGGLDARDEWGRTPLAIAEARGDEKAARVLRGRS